MDYCTHFTFINKVMMKLLTWQGTEFCVELDVFHLHKKCYKLMARLSMHTYMYMYMSHIMQITEDCKYKRCYGLCNLWLVTVCMCIVCENQNRSHTVFEVGIIITSLFHHLCILVHGIKKKNHLIMITVQFEY